MSYFVPAQAAPQQHLAQTELHAHVAFWPSSVRQHLAVRRRPRQINAVGEKAKVLPSLRTALPKICK